jgi:hypothetical protein
VIVLNNDKTMKLLLMSYLVRHRHGHEPGPSEDEVVGMIRDHLANEGLDPSCNAWVCADLLGEDWHWALEL